VACFGHVLNPLHTVAQQPTSTVKVLILVRRRGKGSREEGGGREGEGRKEDAGKGDRQGRRGSREVEKGNG